MNIFNINVPKNEISMAFNPFGESEICNTPLYLHKSNIIFDEENNPYSAQLEIDKNQNTKKDKMIKQILAREYGSFITTFLNADFSNAENAYYSFFVFYGLEGLDYIGTIMEKYPMEYAARYVSTKKFLDYYNKAYEIVKHRYIKFQDSLRKTVDFVYNLHNIENGIDLDKYSKFVAFSHYIDLSKLFYNQVNFKILTINNSEKETIKTLEDVEKLAYDISNNKNGHGVIYSYESTSHLALAYVALNNIIQNSKRNISVCQNCGRYYLQYSGKEVYCDLSNADGSPTCKSYASRKAYDNRVGDDIAELTYKREYQRRITQVYRADKDNKPQIQKEYQEWKSNARKQLKMYRDNKITQEEFCDWIEENK